VPIQKWSDEIWVAKLGPDPGFGEDIDALISNSGNGQSPPDIVLDLSGVDHLNSSQLTRLLRLRKAMIERNRSLRLAGPNDTIWAVLLTTGLDKVFEFSSDATTALAEIQIARGGA